MTKEQPTQAGLSSRKEHGEDARTRAWSGWRLRPFAGEGGTLGKGGADLQADGCQVLPTDGALELEVDPAWAPAIKAVLAEKKVWVKEIRTQTTAERLIA
jgi:hypothetical protein